MHAIIRSISSDEFDIKTFVPENKTNFFLTLRIRIGSDETSGADDFELNVCTPGWLTEAVWQPYWGRHLLIVREYDFSAIEICIRNFVSQCKGNEWNVIAEKLGRFFSWEFEDYKN